MELFFKAEQNYKEKRLQSAYAGYHRCLEEGMDDEKATFLCCQRVVHLSDLLNIQRGVFTEELLARSFFHLARYDHAAKHGETASTNKKSRGIYEILWESYFREGSLSKARKTAEDYLAYCKKKHLCDSGLDFIKKLEEVGMSSESFSIMALELETIRGNKQLVNKRLEKGDSYEAKRCSGYFYLYKEHWEREEIVRKTLLKYWRGELNKKSILGVDTLERKKIIHFALIDFLFDGDEFYKTLEDYARAFKRKDLLESLEGYKSQKGQVIDVQEDVDFDLDNRHIRNEAGAIPRKSGCYDFSFDELKSNKVGIYLDGLNDDFLFKNVESLLIALVEMNLYESALKLFDRLRDEMKKESAEYQINMAYLEVVSLGRSGQYRKAMDLLNDSLSMLPVKEQEREMFLKERDFLVKKISFAEEKI